MTMDLQAVLKEHFAFDFFRPGQKESIESALKGQDTLVILPTGSGKSVCYQLFPYLLRGTTLIISPLISLMQDQVDKIRLRGEKRVCALNSSLTKMERAYIRSNIKAYKFIYLSPEMLAQSYVLDLLQQIHINLLVVDEAHCVSQWGMDFRPDYLQIASFRKSLDKPTLMALTATARPAVQDQIMSLLDFDPDQSQVIKAKIDRPEIKYSFEEVEDKDQRLFELVKNLKKPGLVYFSSKKQADRIAQALVQRGFRAESYHADKSDYDKRVIQNQFLAQQIQVVCATSAFGMGIDKKDIRFVIHYHMPGDPEVYLQETGRCSRDGRAGLALCLYQRGDEKLQAKLKLKSIPQAQTIQFVFRKPQQVKDKDDNQYKLIKYFYDQGWSLEDTLAFFYQRKQFILKQVQFMRSLVDSDRCIRQSLLAYFGDQSPHHEEFCCSVCQPGIEKQFYGQEGQEEDSLEIKPVDKILRSLYNPMYYQ